MANEIIRIITGNRFYIINFFYWFQVKEGRIIYPLHVLLFTLSMYYWIILAMISLNFKMNSFDILVVIYSAQLLYQGTK
ncbi:hypothetical protein RCL_jg5092.t1 [Rhizophagus clarus]|uniref:Uncharacterized protein n=1 Tax=Rhizophagus clarus TaxID=94130 RepID=A0A8H3LBD8_9GLOM|nr:hypothetical protein RCL_jg5092.t1 [Rhizophagus clarus]